MSALHRITAVLLAVLTLISTIVVPVSVFATPPKLAVVAPSSRTDTRLSLVAHTLDARRTNPSDLVSYTTGEILVKFRSERVNLATPVGMSASRSFAVSKGLSIKHNDTETNLAILSTESSGASLSNTLTRLRTDPRVEYAQPNFVYHELAEPTSDTLFHEQWGLYNTGQSVNSGISLSGADINYLPALDIFTGSFRGDPVTVAVIDSGMAWNHPDLSTHMWSSTGCLSDTGASLGTCTNGYDFADNDNDPTPMTESPSHGTMVSGIIGAVVDNSRGIAGIDPNVRIMGLRSNLTTAEIIRAIHFAGNNGAKVINASWGMYQTGSIYYDQALYDAIHDFPGLFVVAAGNCGFDHEDGGQDDGSNTNPQCTNKQHVNYPQNFARETPLGLPLTNMIVVAATDEEDHLASYSDYGSNSIDIGAPGTDIYSTVVTRTTTYDQDFNSSLTGSVGDFSVGGGTANRWGVDSGVSSYGVFTDATGTYGTNENTYIEKDTSLTGASAALDFYAWCDTPITGTYNSYLTLSFSSGGGVFTDISDRINEEYIGLAGGSSVSIGSFSGAGGSFHIDLSAYRSNTFKMRFRWVTNGVSGGGAKGCFVDDVKLYSYDNGENDGYDIASGTSFAAPHVAGLAAMAMSYRPDIAYQTIKSTILTQGDQLASLSGMTVSGKRINAYNTLLALTDRPTIPAVNMWRSTQKILEVSESNAKTNASNPYFEWEAPTNIPSATMSGYLLRLYSGATLLSSTASTLLNYTAPTISTNGHFTFSIIPQKVDSSTGVTRSFIFDTYIQPPYIPTNVRVNNNTTINSLNASNITIVGSGSRSDSGATMVYRMTGTGATGSTLLVTGTGILQSNGAFTRTGVDLSGFMDGNIDYTVHFQNPLGATGASFTGTAYKSTDTPAVSLSFLSGAITNSGTTTIHLVVSKPVTYSLSGAGLTHTYTASLTESGDVTVALTSTDGTKIASVIVTDSGGNLSPVATGSIILDRTDPTIAFGSYANNAIFTGANILLTGSTSDTNDVVSVSVNGTIANGTGTWWIPLAMTGGANPISVIATDSIGNISNPSTITVYRIPDTVRLATPIVTGTSSGTVRFATNIPSIGVVKYGRVATTLSSTAIENGSGTLHSIGLTGLQSDTQYFFGVYGTVADNKNGTISRTFTFRTPRRIDTASLTGVVVSTGSVTFSGSTASGVSLIPSGTGASDGVIRLASQTGASSIFLPAGIHILAQSGTWDGVINAPVLEDATGGSIGVTGYVRNNGLTYHIGSESDGLIFSGGSVSVSLDVSSGSYATGQTLKVFRSSDGQATFGYVSDCQVTDSTCTFNTNHFSDFTILEGTDSTPDAFTFTTQVGVAAGTAITSNTVTLSGINTVTSVSISSGATLVLNGSDFTGATTTVFNGNTIAMKILSSATAGGTATGSITVGDMSASFTVLTTSTPSSGGSGGGGSSGGNSSGGGGGGGYIAQPDSCPNGDTSGNSYDGKCSTPSSSGATTGSANTLSTASDTPTLPSLIKPGFKLSIPVEFAMASDGNGSDSGVVLGELLGSATPSIEQEIGTSVDAVSPTDAISLGAADGSIVHGIYTFTDMTKTKTNTLGTVGGTSDVLLVNNDSPDVSMLLPAGMIATGNASWDGTMNAPQIESQSDSRILIRVGSTQSLLVFDRSAILSVPVVWTDGTTVTIASSSDGKTFSSEDSVTVVGGKVDIATNHCTLFTLTADNASVRTYGTGELTDITDSFARSQILFLYRKGVVRGYGDGTFHPSAPATRAEFLKMVMEAFRIDYASGDFRVPSFADTTIGWHIQVSKKAKELGIISGQKFGDLWYFRPNDTITRAEAVKILLGARGITVDTSVKRESAFDDVSEGWTILYTVKAKELGIVAGQKSGTKNLFRPSDPITRQEVAKILVKTLLLPSSATTSKTPVKKGVAT